LGFEVQEVLEVNRSSIRRLLNLTGTERRTGLGTPGLDVLLHHCSVRVVEGADPHSSFC